MPLQQYIPTEDTLLLHHSFKLLRTSHDALVVYPTAGGCSGPAFSHLAGVEDMCCVLEAYHVMDCVGVVADPVQRTNFLN